MSVSRNVLLTIAAFVIICCCRVDTYADPLVLTLSNPVQTVTPGQTVILFASVANNSNSPQTIGLVGIDANSILVDISSSPAVSNFFLVTIAGGSMLGPLPFATVGIPAGLTEGTIITGQILIGNFQLNDIETANYMITVATPEPATLLLLGTGVAGLVGAVRRRRKEQR
jgi:PEP-CTERM motif-containing protein